MIRWRGFPRSRGLRLRAVAAGAVAVLTALLFVAIRRHPLALAAAWSGAMLASFAGWGGIVNLWFSPGRRADWGLRAGWGMALSILVGGYLCVVGAAVRPVLVAQVVVGLTLLLGDGVLHPPRVTLRRLGALAAKPGVPVLVAGGYLLAGLELVGNLGQHGFQPSDDPPFYFVLAEKLVQASSLFHPFMGRRISTFGGHVYLTASFIAVSSVYYLFVVDGGICLLLVVGLLFGEVRGTGFKSWHAAPLGLLVLLLFSLADVRVNTASLFSGLAGVLTLYRTIRFRSEAPGASSWPIAHRRLALLSALATACVLLRTSNAAAVIPLVLLVGASDFALGARRPYDRSTARSLMVACLVVVAAFVVALLPWSLMMKRSCGTFFYPLGHDNLTPGWTFLKPAQSWDEAAKNFVQLLFNDIPISVCVPFLVVGFLPLSGARRNDLFALTVASVVGVLALARGATAFGAHDTSRYYFAFVVAMALAVTASVERRGPRLAMVAMSIGVHLATSRDGIRDRLELQIREAGAALAEKPTELAAFAGSTSDYRELQSKVPAGATLAAAVHEPWRFDFKRNEIDALDVLGGMGPSPGWPAFRGPEVLGDYLHANGVRFLAWVDFGLPSEFYNRSHWQGFLPHVESYLSAEARFQLDAMDAIEKLSAVHRVVYRAHGMTLVDLTASPSPP
jgi:hypothetical protein